MIANDRLTDRDVPVIFPPSAGYTSAGSPCPCLRQAGSAGRLAGDPAEVRSRVTSGSHPQTFVGSLKERGDRGEGDISFEPQGPGTETPGRFAVEVRVGIRFHSNAPILSPEPCVEKGMR